MTHYIYRLIDDAGVVHYVGKSNNPYRRLFDHLASCMWAYSPLADWLRECRINGRVPQVRIVSTCRHDNRTAERREVQRCIREGHPILNLSYSGRSRTEEEAKAAYKRMIAFREQHLTYIVDKNGWKSYSYAKSLPLFGPGEGTLKMMQRTRESRPLTGAPR